MDLDLSRLIIVDPGCNESLGHHPVLDRLMLKFASQNNMEARVLVSKECDPSVVRDMSAEAVLTQNVYSKIPRSTEDLHKAIEDSNKQFAEELKMAVPKLEAGDIVVVHTINQFGLSGLAEWALQARSSKTAFRILLRFPTSFSALQDVILPEFQTVIDQSVVNAFDCWKNEELNARFFVDTLKLAEDYARYGAFDFGSLPISIDFSDFQQRPEISATADRDPTFIFAGSGRKEKGIDILPLAIEKYYARGGRGKFVVQAVDKHLTDTRSRLSSISSNVSVLDSVLVGSEYFDFLQSGDVVLIPYDPKKYRLRTSHIFMEALGVGRPVIATGKTWMEEQLLKLDGDYGVIASEYTSESLAAACLEFYSHWQTYLENARANAAIIRSANNNEAFIQAFLGDLLTQSHK